MIDQTRGDRDVESTNGASPGHSGPEPAAPVDGETLADADQTAADTDQTAADTDQTAADIDQTAADNDQAAADDDQAASDRDLVHGGDPEVHDSSQDVRDRSAQLRQESADDRVEASTARDQAAKSRDVTAMARDRAASERDRGALLHDREAAACDPAPAVDAYQGTRAELARRAEVRRISAAAHRATAAKDRAQAAADRRQAAEDRAGAAADRREATRDRARTQARCDEILEQLAIAETDQLTGARTRMAGLAEFDHEIDRARRATGLLVIAYVDVVGLKAANDTYGHAHGDALLRRAVHGVRDHLRSYDLIVRLGGDEFLCVMSGTTIQDARHRFTTVQTVLATGPDRCEINIGFASLAAADTATQLIERADAELLITTSR